MEIITRNRLLANSIYRNIVTIYLLIYVLHTATLKYLQVIFSLKRFTRTLAHLVF